MVSFDRPAASHSRPLSGSASSGAPTLASSRLRPTIAASGPRIAPRNVPGPSLAPARVTHISHDSVGSVNSTVSPGRGRGDTAPKTPDPVSGNITLNPTPNGTRPSPRPAQLQQQQQLHPSSGPHTRSAGTPNIALTSAPTAPFTPKTNGSSASDRPSSRDRPAFFHMSELRRPETITRSTGKRMVPQRPTITPSTSSRADGPPRTIFSSPPVNPSSGPTVNLPPPGSRSRQQSISNSASHHPSPSLSDSHQPRFPTRSPSPHKDREAHPPSHSMYRKSGGAIGTTSHFKRPSSIRGYSHTIGTAAGTAADSTHNSRQPSIDSVGTIGTSMSASSNESRPGRRPGLGVLFSPPQQQSLPPPQLTQQPQSTPDASFTTPTQSIPPASTVMSTPTPAAILSTSPNTKQLFFVPHTQSSPGRGTSPSRPAGFDESVAEARRERKILDLEISNSSLLAINRQLEKEIRKQRSELRRFRRLTRAGRLSDFSIGPTAMDLIRESGGEGDFADFSHPPGLEPVPENDAIKNSSLGLGLDDSAGDGTDSEDGMSPAATSSRLISDEQRLRSDLEKHRQLLVDNQKLSHGLTRCFWKTEELIKMGKEALAYQVTVTDVPLTGILGGGSGEMTDTDADVDGEDNDDDLDGIDIVGSVVDSVADTYDPYTDTDTNFDPESRPATASSSAGGNNFSGGSSAASSYPSLPPGTATAMTGRPYIRARLPSPRSPPPLPPPPDKSLDLSLDLSSFDPDSTIDNTVVSEKDSVAAAMNAIRLWSNASPSAPSRVMAPRYQHKPVVVNGDGGGKDPGGTGVDGLDGLDDDDDDFDGDVEFARFGERLSGPVSSSAASGSTAAAAAANNHINSTSVIITNRITQSPSRMGIGIGTGTGVSAGVNNLINGLAGSPTRRGVGRALDGERGRGRDRDVRAPLQGQHPAPAPKFSLNNGVESVS